MFLRICIGLIGGLAALASIAATSFQQPSSLVSPTYSEPQATRGATVYDERCAQCHGAALDDGQFAPALLGASFQLHWQNQSLADLFSIVRSQMPPDAPGSLSESAAADVVAFVLKQNGLPASSSELSSDPKRLQTMYVVKPQ